MYFERKTDSFVLEKGLLGDAHVHIHPPSTQHTHTHTHTQLTKLVIQYVLSVVAPRQRDVLKSSITDNGGQCVMIYGVPLMLRLCVNS